MAPVDWRPVGIDQLEPNAWNALRHEGSSFVVAGPGAGKTEFLAQRADYLFSTRQCPPSRSILAISFKRDAARNLAARVGARTPDSTHRFDSLTFDAFTKGLVDRFRSALPEPWRIEGDYEISLRESGEPPDLDGLAARHPKLAAEFAAIPRDNFVNKVVGTYALPIGGSNAKSARELASLAWWNQRFGSTETKRVSFVMLNRLAELIVRANPAIRRALLVTYPFVFIDEFQDTTFAQYSFLRSVFGSGRTVVTAVGDDKQRIMGWAGALDNAFAEFQNDFTAQRFELNWNFRSSSAMTRVHHVVAKALNDDVSPAVSQVDADVEDDAVVVWHFDDLDDEARGVAQWISEDTASSGRSPDRYALLARQKTVDLQQRLEAELAQRGIPLRNDDEEVGTVRLQDLLADEFAKGMLDLLRVAASYGGNGDAWMRTSGLISRMHDGPADDETLSRSHRSLDAFVARLRRCMLSNPPDSPAIGQALGDIVSYLGIPAIQSAFPAQRQRSYLEDTVAALTARLEKVVGGAEGWEDLCDRAEGRGAVPLMTIHKSKGLEYHTVIVLGLDDRQWWSFGKDPIEAIRTFFVGLSRAEQRTIFTHCTARGGRKGIEALYSLLAETNVAHMRPQS
ncbi:UvrD-helicase domain-containing protein [Candidatus Poriferisodalis sp.]|uniref:UvrD-helicase domain-containing protein n=1 Tax=Candidatus Poriferisodalis sp. TaxID=3101277 RepID=UPI003AF4FA32